MKPHHLFLIGAFFIQGCAHYGEAPTPIAVSSTLCPGQYTYEAQANDATYVIYCWGKK